MTVQEITDLEIYRMALKLSDEAWSIYGKIPQSVKYHMGDQLIRSVDSIGANIAEGFGRHHLPDSLRFYYISRGSLSESRHWITLLFKRKMINKEEYDEFNQQLKHLGIKLNNFITSIIKKIKQPNNNRITTE